MVEVKVPLFTRAAWLTIHEHLLSKVPPEALTADKQIDLVRMLHAAHAHAMPHAHSRAHTHATRLHTRRTPYATRHGNQHTRSRQPACSIRTGDVACTGVVWPTRSSITRRLRALE